MTLTFLLNGESVELTDVAPTTTLLDWLRDARGLTGTKEGCNEGDCGACTVMVSDAHSHRALNACILFLPQLHGKSVRTIEGLGTGPDHPAQQAMIDHHGSQCGFCTPGFVMSMAAAHANGDTDHATTLAGNLCRCTGYAPILRAARTAQDAAKPDWIASDRASLLAQIPNCDTRLLPTSSDDLATLYATTPDATLVAGATDVGLWVTKGLRHLDTVIFLHRCTDLQQITDQGDSLHIGAGVTIEALRHTLTDLHPSFAAMLRRYGSTQVRSAATIGGNIANGSPIGDGPPPLIALGATLHLRRGDTRRDLPLQDFFIDYGKQDRAPGEFVEGLSIPKSAPNLRVYKLSKRFDQDISAVCGAFNISIRDGMVAEAKIAFGGMAGTPKRAIRPLCTLIAQPFNLATIAAAHDAWGQDFTPLSDMRASADYRLTTARNMLTRYFHDLSGHPTTVHEVTI